MPESFSLQEARKRAYELLDLPPTASKEEIKASYRRSAKKYHPDKNASPGAAHLFKACTVAYRFLINGPRELEGSTWLESMTDNGQTTMDEWRNNTAYGKWWFDRFGDF